MDFNLDVRLKQLESLEHYINSSRGKVTSVLNRLKWNVQDLVKDNQLIKCSVDPHHRVHINSSDEHIHKCSLRKEGYTLDEDFLSEPVHNPKSSIFIDDHMKIDVLSNAHRASSNFKSGWNGQDPDPKTSNRLMCTFSSDERLVLYDYAIANTEGPPKPPEFKTYEPPKQTQNLTHEQLLALERDIKRRRAKYKGVFTDHKNYTEVLREIITGQMDLYKMRLESGEELKLVENDDGKEHKTKRSSVSRSSSKTDDSYIKSNKDDNGRIKEYDRHHRRDRSDRKRSDKRSDRSRRDKSRSRERRRENHNSKR
uniref:CHHC U11-48K-type domain-containing protein n=2 Tax=Photinus pyralis TaxID=7054 RepID=A0A1Y1LC03_PHOPY